MEKFKFFKRHVIGWCFKIEISYNPDGRNQGDTILSSTYYVPGPLFMLHLFIQQ